MKSMTCKQLGGACDKIFQADTFEKIAELSKQHGMEMFQAQDEAHLRVMNDMKELMQKPEEKAGFSIEYTNTDDVLESEYICKKVQSF